MALALLLVTLLGCGYLLLLTYNAYKRRQYASAAGTAKWLTLWSGVYLVVLLAFSVTSREKVAGPGEEVRFCGLDWDCRLAASLIEVETRKTVGDPPREIIADGMYYLATVKVTTNAPAPALEPRNLTGVAVDAQGREYPRFPEAERILLSARRGEDPFERVSGPTGGSFKRTLVFDLPAGVNNPALILWEGSSIDRLVELFLIGDEASLFHAKTKLPLRIPERRPF